jgi:hypothetical protein
MRVSLVVVCLLLWGCGSSAPRPVAPQKPAVTAAWEIAATLAGTVCEPHANLVAICLEEQDHACTIRRIELVRCVDGLTDADYPGRVGTDESVKRTRELLPTLTIVEPSDDGTAENPLAVPAPRRAP